MKKIVFVTGATSGFGEACAHIFAKKVFAASVLLFLAIRVEAAPSFQQIGNTLVMSNGNVRLEYNLGTGATDFFWNNSKKISAFYSGVTLGTGYVQGNAYSTRTWAVVGSNQVVVTNTGDGNVQILDLTQPRTPGG